MRTSTHLALAAILLFAALLRLLPLVQYLYWGADFGEYDLIARSLLGSGRPPDPYDGWGIAYPYFPGMEALAAVAHLFGVPLETALLLMAPLLASLSVAAIFLLAWEVTGHEGASLAAAALLAVGMPHVYPTSHAIPGSIGDLLYLAALLGILRARRDRRWMVLLAPILGSIVLMHHFSDYFLIIALASIVFLRTLVHRRPWPGVRTDLSALLLLILLTVAHWYLYATVFRERVLTDEHTVPLWVSMAGFALTFAAFPIFLWLRPALPFAYRPLYPEWPSARKHFVWGVAAGLAFLAYAFLQPIPGTTLMLASPGGLVFVPLLVLVAFAAAGRKYTEFSPGGVTVAAVLVSLFGSMAMGLLISPRALIPYRHVEYILVPAAVFTGAGIAAAWHRQPEGWRRRALPLAVGLLLVGTAASAYPPRAVLGGFFEGYPPGSLDPPVWIQQHVPPGEAIASDHRLSSMAFGFGGHNATWDYINATLHAPDFETAAKEMARVKSPVGYVKISYILVDDDVRAGAMLFPWNPALPLTPEASAKFEKSPYLKIYDDGYSQVYWVDWALSPA